MTDEQFTTEEKAAAYEAVISVFTALFKELRELSKKKPEMTLSSTKIKMLNRILLDVKECLSGEPEEKYLDLLLDDDLPQYGDAILILSQYEGALTAFRGRYWRYQYETGQPGWSLSGEEEEYEDDEEDGEENDDEEEDEEPAT